MKQQAVTLIISYYNLIMWPNMWILYNTTSGDITRTSTHPIPDAIAGHAQAQVDAVKLDLELVKYDTASASVVDRSDKQAILQQRAKNLIRSHRNAKLAMTDWTQLPDVSLTQQQKDQWASYRQALRDMPDSFPDPMPPGYRPTWPQKP